MIAKGKVFITHDELKKLFNLPDEVEFISIQDLSDGIEFNIASKEPVGLLTREVKNWENMRRQRVPRAILKPSHDEETVKLINMNVLQLAQMLEDGLTNACWLNEEMSVLEFINTCLVK